MEAAKTQTRADRLIEAASWWADRRGLSGENRLAFERDQLRSDIRNLCAELDAFKYIPNPSCHYVNLMMGQVPVLVGYGADGDDEFSINEVWCNGQRIDEYLSEDVLGTLRDDTERALAEMRDDARTEAAIARREAVLEAV